METQYKTILVGDYAFDFPDDFRLMNLGGMDSYVGAVVGDRLTFSFDYGWYGNSGQITVEEYVFDQRWLPLAQQKFWHRDPNACIDVWAIRSSSAADSVDLLRYPYIADCEYEGEAFVFPILAPELDDYQRAHPMSYQIDTVDRCMRKIEWSQGDADEWFVNIYLKYLPDSERFGRNCNALGMGANGRGAKQKALALQILRSGRRVARENP